jgi:hypothetical protein|tara:strand:- start:240 stop:491 length:252 start_codon:yes stop_codon:yes gene_type:complete
METSNFKYTLEDVDKIVGYSTWSVKKKIDTLLHIDCVMYANLGIDSTKTDRLETKRKSRSVYRAIKTLDPVIGDSFLSLMDKE